MFGLKKNSEDENYIEASNLHILILDSQWLRLFTNDNKTEEIKKTEKELKALLKEQGRINSEVKRLSKGKGSILSKILEQSNDVRESGDDRDKERLLQRRDYVVKMNESISDMKKRAEDVPAEIAQANNRLFQLSIKQAYNQVSKRMKELKKYDDAINKLRDKLSEQTNKLEKLEDNFKISREIDKIRERISEQTNKKSKVEEEFNANRDFLVSFIGEDGIKQLDSKYNGRI